MLVVAAAIVSRPKEFDITEALLAAGTGFFAFRHARYMPVFMIVALPLADIFSRAAPGCGGPGSGGPVRGHVGLHLCQGRASRAGAATDGRVGEPGPIPREGRDFIVSRNLRGNMYNSTPGAGISSGGWSGETGVPGWQKHQP